MRASSGATASCRLKASSADRIAFAPAHVPSCWMSERHPNVRISAGARAETTERRALTLLNVIKRKGIEALL